MDFSTFFKDRLVAEQMENYDLDAMYDVFKNEYEKTTGLAWTKDLFDRKSRNWNFYGDDKGFIAIRPQKSGFCKLVAAAGSPRSKLKALKEIENEGLPVWGMVSKDIKNMLLKMGFRGPNKVESFFLKQRFAAMFSDVEILNHTEDGGAEMHYPHIGTVIKYFVGSPSYWKRLYSMKALLNK